MNTHSTEIEGEENTALLIPLYSASSLFSSRVWWEDASCPGVKSPTFEELGS